MITPRYTVFSDCVTALPFQSLQYKPFLPEENSTNMFLLQERTLASLFSRVVPFPASTGFLVQSTVRFS